MKNFHYGDLIQSSATGKKYFVRATAPGTCAVCAPDLYPLNEAVPDTALIIFRPQHLEAFELVEQCQDVELRNYHDGRDQVFGHDAVVICSCDECHPEFHYIEPEQQAVLDAAGL